VSGRIANLVRNTLAARFWSRTHAAGGLHTWMAERVVREAINEAVTGSPNTWPLEWLARELGWTGLDRCVSLDCGEGALERDLRRKNIATRVLGIDLSEVILGNARRKASDAGFSGIEYRVGDTDVLDLPDSRFDAAFFHHSPHHVGNLERCLDAVRTGLKPAGLLYLDEYVGPSRGEWRKPMLERTQEVFETLPAAMKRRRRLRLAVDRRDRSEAVRSSEIIEAVESRFVLEAVRPYGGNLLAVIHPYLRLDGVSEVDRSSQVGSIRSPGKSDAHRGRSTGGGLSANGAGRIRTADIGSRPVVEGRGRHP
jgi:SAM-dependent methyltransferase